MNNGLTTACLVLLNQLKQSVQKHPKRITAAVATLLLTGGGGKYVTEFLRHPHVFDPDLTRKGLAYLYRRNHPHRDEA